MSSTPASKSADGAVSDDMAEMILAIGPLQVTSFADIGGQAADLAIALHRRHECEIVLVDLQRDGSFADPPSGWIDAYKAELEDHGVPPAEIRVVSKPGDIRGWDVVANLNGFGAAHKVRHLQPIMEAGLHADSVMITDIKKGSGSFPFLNTYGGNELLWTREIEGREISRVVFRPKPPPAQVDEGWAMLARELAGKHGFYTENGVHSFLFIPRGKTLVVTFDNLDIAMNKREERRPWGFHFIEKQGWSMLGVMANGWTWYRDYWVSSEFDRLRDEGFFDRFDRVVFYGASMGGYAACAFSAVHPGADVVAISPQSTVDKKIVPWETRYKSVWDRDFSGKYGDAALVSQTARRVSILYDPYQPLDASHADRFAGDNVVKLRTPLLGHRLGSSLQQMGILSPIILAALEGALSETEFYRTLRARRDFPRYQRELFQRALDRGRPDLARRIGRWVLKRGESRFIRHAMEAL